MFCSCCSNRDANTTTIFVVGATIGEALVPIVIGQLIDWFGPKAFPASIVCTQVSLLVLYVLVHILGSHAFPLLQYWLEDLFDSDSSNNESHSRMGCLRNQLQYASDLFSLYIARSKAYCGLISSLPQQQQHLKQKQQQQHVRFNPVLDVCRLSSNDDTDDTSFEDGTTENLMNSSVISSCCEDFEVLPGTIAREEEIIFTSFKDSPVHELYLNEANETFV